MSYADAIDKAREESKKGYVQHVNQVTNHINSYASYIQYVVSDWLDDSTVISFENGKEL